MPTQKVNTLERTSQANTFDLLSTKLTHPHLRSPLVVREALLARLEAGLVHKLTLVSAPAGFGKTTLVAEWIQRSGIPNAAFAWVALDAGDNDPVRFWRYVITACQTFDPAVGSSSLALLQTSQQPPFEAVLTAFINELAGLSGRAVLALEDYHVITSGQVHKTLAFLLDHLPATLHVILMTRSDPPLPLARLRARYELNELRADDLRFSPAETAAFLRQAIPFSLPPDAAPRLTQRTEGWAAGLRLVALALQWRPGPREIEEFLATFGGSLRPIQEYLVADVLGAQPQPVQEFLLQTSILSRLTGSLCDAVLGTRDRGIGESGIRDQGTGLPDPLSPDSLSPDSLIPDSQATLEYLERTNLFLVPLDGVGQWYRYHGLFAEAMQHYARLRLGEARLRELSLNASLWYAEHGLLDDAVEAALTAQDYRRAADLIERVVARQLLHNEKHTLRRWMGHLPEVVLSLHPRLCFMYAGAILFTSDRHAPETRALVEPPLHIAEQAWRAADDRPRLGELMTFRSLVEWLQGDVWQSFATARRGLELLPEGETQWRGIGLVMVGTEELLGGKLHAARGTLTQARALGQATGNLYVTLDSALTLADVCARQGDLQQAAGFYRQVFSEAERAPMDRDRALLRQGRALTGLAALALEWNDLEAAERDATQAGDIGRQLANEDLQVHSSLVLARVLHTRGETQQAQQLLHSLVAETKQPLLLREAQACQAWLALTAGASSALPFPIPPRPGSPVRGPGETGTVAGQALAAVQRWAVANVQSGEDVPLIQQEQEALIVAHVLIAQSEPDAALRVLDEWQIDSHVQGRTRTELQIAILQALAHAALDRQVEAGQTLARALALAQPEGYRRLFLDEGRPMADLLRAALPDLRGEPLVEHARTLLVAFAEGPTGPAAPSAPVPGLLIEPLSPQEQRVLRLLAAGLSNAEIAKELVVSINTVKTHVRNVYGKLDVHSREDAREAARELKLASVDV